MKFLLLALTVGLGFAGALWAGDPPPAGAPVPASPSAATPDGVALADRFGLGINTNPLNLYGYKGYATPGPMVSARWWFNPRSALELGFGAASSYADSGFAAGGKELLDTYYAEEEQVGYRRRLGHPVPFVWITGIASLSAVQDDGLTYTAVSGGPAVGRWSGVNSVYTVYLGVGFEAYLPCWPDLSVEGSVGVSPGGTVYWDAADRSYVWEWAVETDDSGLSPVNAAVHYYF